MAAVGLVWNVQCEGEPRVNSSRINLASLFSSKSWYVSEDAVDDADDQGRAKKE
jgi:hypothetical protein